jgi:hypothetical protein
LFAPSSSASCAAVSCTPSAFDVFGGSGEGQEVFLLAATRVHLGVALQVAFERQTLKPVFHLIGYRLWV